MKNSIYLQRQNFSSGSGDDGTGLVETGDDNDRHQEGRRVDDHEDGRLGGKGDREAEVSRESYPRRVEQHDLEALVSRALAEDVGSGDVTTAATVAPGTRAKAWIIQKAPGVVFGLDIAASYAPEIHLDGVVAGAPPSQFEAIYAFLTASPFQFYLFMAGAGFNVAYGNTIAPLSEIITPKGQSLLPIVGQGCSDFLAQKLNQIPLASIVPKDPFTVPSWKTLLQANDPGNFTTPSTAPLLIIQGGSDEQIPVITTQLLKQHECSIGQDVERWIYPGQSHAGVIPVSMTDMVTWMTDRFAGGPNPDPYVPTGTSGYNGPPTTTECAT